MIAWVRRWWRLRSLRRELELADAIRQAVAGAGPEVHAAVRDQLRRGAPVHFARRVSRDGLRNVTVGNVGLRLDQAARRVVQWTWLDERPRHQLRSYDA